MKLLVLFVSFLSSPAGAQRIAEAKFEEAFRTIPKPKPTLKETMEQFSEPETYNKLFENSFAEQKVPTAFIQQCF